MELLVVHWNVDPAILHLGPLEIRWYSLLFVSGFILGWFIVRDFCRRENVSEKLLDPLLYTMIIATIVGARLGHCLFYQPDYYFGSWKGFAEVFMPWKGGLASHGGTIALILALLWFARHYKKQGCPEFFWIADHVIIPIAFAACFIRLGNLFNSEIYGDVTNLPWGFVFERRGETLPKHPTQLYEGGTYLILGLVLYGLYLFKDKKLYRGMITGIFMIVCFGSRILIEFIKEPQVGFEENMVLNMGQILSIPFVLFGIWCIVWACRNKKPVKYEKPAPPKKAEPTHYAKSLAK